MSILKEAKIGILWTFMKQFSIQIINFCVQIILARILLPEEFGLIAMITVFIAVGQSLMDSGLTSSLIRFPNVTNKDYSTVFWTNLVISFFVYVIVWSIAPQIAVFYNQDVLKGLLRIYSLSFVINSLNAVQIAKLTKELNFKSQFYFQFPSVLIAAIIGIYLAYSGYGVWSIVYLNLVQAFFFVIITWFYSKWKPDFFFDRELFKKHFSFGYKLTISGLLDTIYQNLYKILIGKYFAPAAVGYFSQADNLRLFPVNQLSAILDKVTFPLFSNLNDDIHLKSAFRKAMNIVLSISAGGMIILILIAKPFITLILGVKWEPSVYYFQILCIASVFRPLGAYNLNILKVKGRSDLFLKVEVIKKIIGVVAIIISIPFGIEGLVWGLCLTNVFFAYFNGSFSGKFINYTVIAQLKESLSILVISILPIPLCLVVKNLILVESIYIIIGLPIIYLIQYFILSLIFNKELIREMKRFIKV
ncbi:hypothetical protein HMPREF9711_00915 [Myroides odoratimimus CCUG 3837]|uniref:lipopolysaccharide biosynthesis protein n=1 Tax=Myroides odoratimimus TaxID=76832 RepID=UPI000280A2EA|nr:lipopolysaccharide biosynthesis protein [Myroides odoratimimus]EKB05946.1 hypothetical protein HMPREF9711_00915 [Myroides odoratimimus CCUG 3837]